MKLVTLTIASVALAAVSSTVFAASSASAEKLLYPPKKIYCVVVSYKGTNGTYSQMTKCTGYNVNYFDVNAFGQSTSGTYQYEENPAVVSPYVPVSYTYPVTYPAMADATHTASLIYSYVHVNPDGTLDNQNTETLFSRNAAKITPLVTPSSAWKQARQSASNQSGYTCFGGRKSCPYQVG